MIQGTKRWLTLESGGPMYIGIGTLLLIVVLLVIFV